MAENEIQIPSQNIINGNTVSTSASPLWQRCCLHFYNTSACPHAGECEYLHKSRWEMDIMSVCDLDCFLGRPRLMQQRCRYYLRGYCVHANTCRFKHGDENDDTQLQRVSEAAAATAATNQTSGYNDGQTLGDLPQIQYVSILDNKSSDESGCENAEQESCSEAKGACASPPTPSPKPLDIDEWVKAPEFVPKAQLRARSYAEALSPGQAGQGTAKDASRKLCPYASKEGVCRNLANCAYVHGELCDMCERFVLHPYDEEEKKRHRQECLQRHEKDMELSFAIARSKEKSCGVCFEIIMEKADGEQRFGILPNCNHCFCLSCIRKWRQARQFENKIIRACPECRVTSDFVCPSMYWVDTKEEKEKLIEDYKSALSRKDCKYFKRGEGKCPFGNKCFYLHAGPDGQQRDVGPPPRQRRGRSVDHEINMLQLMLWDFLDERDFPWQSLADDLEDLVSFLADSDESDWSDYEQYDLFFD